MRKLALLAAVAVGVGLAAPSFAGERGGNGAWTPIGTYVVVAAICSFSGLEDQDHGGPVGDVVPGVTQTPHAEGGHTNPPGVASVCQFLNPGKNPKPGPPPPE